MPGQHSDKEKRQAQHIKLGYIKRGVSEKEAESRAWATVNSERNPKRKGLGALRGK